MSDILASMAEETGVEGKGRRKHHEETSCSEELCLAETALNTSSNIPAEAMPVKQKPQAAGWRSEQMLARSPGVVAHLASSSHGLTPGNRSEWVASGN